ncbi:MAG: sugar ABC transporter permease, partial [Planctomycetota bacterium]
VGGTLFSKNFSPLRLRVFGGTEPFFKKVPRRKVLEVFVGSMRRKVYQSILAYCFIFPFLIIFIFFLLYPIFYSFYLSFHEVTVFSDWYDPFGDMEFVGLANYFYFLGDVEFWFSLGITLIYGLLTIPLGIFLSLVLALLLSSKLRFRNFFRSAYFLPNVLDLLVVGIIWTLIFSPHYGLLDRWMGRVGIRVFSDGVLSDPWTCLPVIALAMVLKGLGFGMVLFLGAIQNIPSTLYEAAEIDGANSWQRFRYITLPLVRPVILFMVITGTIASLTAFAEVYAMTSNTGGPTVEFLGKTVRAANLAGYFLYTYFAEGFYGKAAAFSFLLWAVAMVISYVNVRFLYRGGR